MASLVTPRRTPPAGGRLRVAQLIKSLGRGGAETVLRECLRCAGSRVDYSIGYFLPHKRALVPELEDLGASVTCFSAPTEFQMLLATRRVARWLREIDADLLHCHLPLAGVIGRLAGKVAGVPVVYTEHNLQARYHPLTYRANRATWGLQQAVIAVSSDVAGSIEARIGNGVPVRTIPNGVDVDRFRPDPQRGVALRSRMGIPADVPLVGTVAVFRTQKKLDDWLHAARVLVETHSDAHFLVVGDGPLREELEQLVRRLGLLDRVTFPGLQTDVRDHLAAMDVYMMSSIFEGLPIALLEAMAMGVPPVVTNVGGIGEVVEDRTSGLLTEPGDPERLAGLASLLLDDRDLRGAMGAAARSRVESQYSVRRMSDDIHEMYLELVEQRRQPTPVERRGSADDPAVSGELGLR